MITSERYYQLMKIKNEYEKWSAQFINKNGWTVIPADAKPPVEFTNTDRSEIEVYEFVMMPPTNYFLYINHDMTKAETFSGDLLGTVRAGRPWKDNFGGTRVPVNIDAINGERYVGTYFKSAGDYARVRMAKPPKKREV